MMARVPVQYPCQYGSSCARRQADVCLNKSLTAHSNTDLSETDVCSPGFQRRWACQETLLSYPLPGGSVCSLTAVHSHLLRSRQSPRCLFFPQCVGVVFDKWP